MYNVSGYQARESRALAAISWMSTSTTAQVEAAPKETEKPGATPQVEAAPKEAEAPSATPQFEAYKFTPAQQAAAATALAAQEKVAAAAEAASAEEKAKVGSNWKSACGGPALERMLKDMTLVDAQYFIALTEAGGVVPRYQELPAAARIGPHNAWRLRCWERPRKLPVLVLS